MEDKEQLDKTMKTPLSTSAEPQTKPKPKPKLIVAAAVIAAIVVICGAAFAVRSFQPIQNENNAVDSTTQAQPTTATSTFNVTADGFTDTSSPVISHIKRDCDNTSDIDTYHAFSAQDIKDGGKLDMREGKYQITYISPINTDGSIYNVPDTQYIDAGSIVDTSLEHVDASQVTSDQLTNIINQIGEAAAHGDASVAGDAGVAIAHTAADNASHNPNANKDAINAASNTAQEAAASNTTPSNPVTPAVPANGGSSNSGSNSGSSSNGDSNGGSSSGSSSNGGSSAPAPAPAPVPEKHSRVVHHEAVMGTRTIPAKTHVVHHDAVTHEDEYYLTSDGRTFYDISACEDYCVINDVSYQVLTKTVVDRAAYDETVVDSPAHDESYVIKPAWDETVWE